MSFTFPMDTSISPHFHLLFHGLELKIWLFGVLFTSLALWIIWKVRCDVVFNNAHIHLRTMLIEFWLLFVHTLHGQYDDLQGSTDVLWQRQVDFKKRWQGLHLFSNTTSSLRWNYAIPSFLLHSL